ncbi:hypothetical protein VTL71DRAFT_2761 [Oculimacula yallundae]|uniref:Uncharacterized protein n=1 Tax=Oculimacula yallundae TaxID=86028 RepID=A0ABR4C9Z1_9HELO
MDDMDVMTTAPWWEFRKRQDPNRFIGYFSTGGEYVPIQCPTLQTVSESGTFFACVVAVPTSTNFGIATTCTRGSELPNPAGTFTWYPAPHNNHQFAILIYAIKFFKLNSIAHIIKSSQYWNIDLFFFSPPSKFSDKRLFSTHNSISLQTTIIAALLLYIRKLKKKGVVETERVVVVPGDPSGKVELEDSPFMGGTGTGGDGRGIGYGNANEVHGQNVVEADGGDGRRTYELPGWTAGR